MKQHQYIDINGFIEELDKKVNRLYQISYLVAEMSKLNLDVEPFDSWINQLNEVKGDWKLLKTISNIPVPKGSLDTVELESVLFDLLNSSRSKLSWILFSSEMPKDVSIDLEAFIAFFKILILENPPNNNVLKLNFDYSNEPILSFKCHSFKFWKRHYLLNQIFEFTPSIWDSSFPNIVSWKCRTESTKIEQSQEKNTHDIPHSIVIRSKDYHTLREASSLLCKKGFKIFIHMNDPSSMDLPKNELINFVLNIDLKPLHNSLEQEGQIKQFNPEANLTQNIESLVEWFIKEAVK